VNKGGKTTSYNRTVTARKPLTRQFQKPYGYQPVGLEGYSLNVMRKFAKYN
jgi:hypothetical protein